MGDLRATGPSAGDEVADFVRLHHGRLLGLAVLLSDRRADAEDLLQDALVRTARRWQAARENPQAYVRRVLVNLAHDRRRNASRRVREVELTAGADRAGEPDPSDPTVARADLFAACATLPERQRTALVLRYWADLSIAETAAAMGCSEGAVKTHTHRALAAVREHLTDPSWVPPAGARNGDDPR